MKRHPLSEVWLTIYVMLTILAALALVLASSARAVTPTPRLSPPQAAVQARAPAYLVKEVRHELALLPAYSIFDWLQFEVQPGGAVTLLGQVRRAGLKSEAEYVVKRIEGVKQVVNQIEVLPPAPNDERARRVVHRALFNWNSPLFHYSVEAVPPIHLIVKEGAVTLKGMVESKADADLATLLTNGLPGVLKVTNDLTIEQINP